ncbi:MAG: hypothetical protein U0166_23415 [Acidobacteriota bacterium]
MPDIVVRIARGDALPGPLGLTFRSPEILLAMTDEERAMYGGTAVVPLWADGNSDHVVAHDDGSGMFVRIDVEEGLDLLTAPRLDWQQVLVADFLSMYELESEDGAFRELARQFGFEHAEEIIEAHAAGDLSTSESHDSWMAALLRRIGARS